ncbi:MAG: nuclear transport factor 2 family protein [Candidatus Acidiferrales bacterium]
MKEFVGVVLLACACAGLVFAQTQTPPANDSSIAQAVKQVEHDWTDAMIAANVDKLDQILADDWVAIGPDGSSETKAAYLADMKSGTLKIETFDFGPMDVKVLGNVAVVQGSDTEKSSYKGKDTSGKWAWMDVFVKRNGKWVAVRSQNAKVQ